MWSYAGPQLGGIRCWVPGARPGIMKEMQPVLSATHQGKPSVYQGHSFQVEAAVNIGGSEVKSGMKEEKKTMMRIVVSYDLNYFPLDRRLSN